MDQKRFLLAMVLSGAVLVLWQAFLAPEPPKEDKKANQTKSASKDGDQTSEASQTEDSAGQKQAGADGELGRPQAAGDGDDAQTGDAGAGRAENADAAAGGDGGQADEQALGEKAGDAKAGGDQAGEKAKDGGQLGQKVMETAEPADKKQAPIETHTLHTGNLEVTVTNAGGGRVQAIHVLNPKQYEKRGNLLDRIPEGSPHLPFATTFYDGERALGSGTAYEFIEADSEKAKDGSWKQVTYRYTDPKDRYAIDKTFSMSDDSPFVLKMDVEVTNNLADRVLGDKLTVDIFGYKDPDKETSMLNFRPNNVKGLCKMGDAIQRSSISGLENPLLYENSPAYWGGVNTRYFMWSAIPEESADSCGIQKVDAGYLRTRLTFKEFSVAAGKSKTLSNELFLGPKDVDILHDVGHSLSASVDYGLFAFIARPLRWMLDKIQGVVVNWGLAIILLTVLIKLLTWPINMKAYRSMDGMKKIQPELEELREKYEDDRQKMTEETMKLFQEHDVSPMGGCLPMLLQMPILYGLYVMIYSSVELYHADFILWYDNLAAPDPFYVLPILMGVVMFGQQQMMNTAGSNTQAKIMTKVMPVIFTAFMLFLPSGLVLYYSINLLIGLGQQFYVRSQREADEAAAEAEGA